MRNKLIAVAGALMLSAGALQAQAGTTTKGSLDINTASRTELASAGWGQYADAIIAGRPYKSMNDLVEKKVVPQKAYDKENGKFTIGDGKSPAANGKMADPMAPPAGTSATVQPGTTPAATPGINPTVTPGTTPTTTPGTTPTMTPGTTPAAPTPASPSK